MPRNPGYARGGGGGHMRAPNRRKNVGQFCKINYTTNKSTGWPKSNVPKVRAYCSTPDHLIRKIFSGMCRDIHWFEEYLKIIEIDDHFFE